MGLFSRLVDAAKEISAGARAATPKESPVMQAARPAASVGRASVFTRSPKEILYDKYWPLIRYRMDGYDLGYAYDVAVEVTDEPALTAYILGAETKFDLSFTAQKIADELHIAIQDGTDIGVLRERTDMLSDWIQRGDPYVIGHKQYHEDGSLTVRIGFYRDRKKGQEWREQTVVALTTFSSEGKQALIERCEVGQELRLHEDGDQVIVTDVGNDEMGRVPARIAKRIMEEGAYGAFFEKTIDATSKAGYYKQKPFIRIYW